MNIKSKEEALRNIAFTYYGGCYGDGFKAVLPSKSKPEITYYIDVTRGEKQPIGYYEYDCTKKTKYEGYNPVDAEKLFSDIKGNDLLENIISEKKKEIEELQDDIEGISIQIIKAFY